MESREADEKKKSIENVLPDSVIFLILLLIQTMWIVGGGGGREETGCDSNKRTALLMPLCGSLTWPPTDGPVLLVVEITKIFGLIRRPTKIRAEE